MEWYGKWKPWNGMRNMEWYGKSEMVMEIMEWHEKSLNGKENHGMVLEIWNGMGNLKWYGTS